MLALARIWPWLSCQTPGNVSRCPLFARLFCCVLARRRRREPCTLNEIRNRAVATERYSRNFKRKKCSGFGKPRKKNMNLERKSCHQNGLLTRLSWRGERSFDAVANDRVLELPKKEDFPAALLAEVAKVSSTPIVWWLIIQSPLALQAAGRARILLRCSRRLIARGASTSARAPRSSRFWGVT